MVSLLVGQATSVLLSQTDHAEMRIADCFREYIDSIVNPHFPVPQQPPAQLTPPPHTKDSPTNPVPRILPQLPQQAPTALTVPPEHPILSLLPRALRPP
jgi:hypothetical protein